MARVVAALAGLAASAPVGKVHFSIDTSTPLATPKAEPSYLGVNIDAASFFEGTTPHRLDILDPGLLAVATHFCRASPKGTILRLGGSSADDLAFVPANSSAALYPGQRIHVDQAYWDDIVRFATEAGCSIVWDLNADSMRNPDGSWNSSNAEALLKHIADSKQELYGFQLGNEPGHWWTRHYPNGTWGDRLGQDFLTLKTMLKDIFARRGRPLPRILGPDVCNGGMNNTSPCSNMTYVRDFLKAASPVLDAVTVHHYGLYFDRDCTLERFLDPDLAFDYDLKHLRAWRDAQRELAPNARLILGETATCGDGGCVGLSNTFAAGFFNIHRLSHAAAIGYDMVFRQDLVGFSGINGGSSYALAGGPGWVGGADSPPLKPNPDLFSSILFKQLVGKTHLQVRYQSPWPKSLSLHAACASTVWHRCGDILLMYANIGTSAVVLSDSSLDMGTRVEYVLSSGDGNVTAPSVILNDRSRPLELGDSLFGRPVLDGSPLTLPARTYGFVVVETMSGIVEHLCGCEAENFVV